MPEPSSHGALETLTAPTSVAVAGPRAETLIIGAGQAGLATAYHLRRLGRDAVILEAGDVGESWRRRWDSLRLFTASEYNDLPGLPFPAPRGHFPARDEVVDYLSAYVAQFDLDVRTGVTVHGVERNEDGFRVRTSEGLLEATNVVVATGAFHTPHVPDAARGIAHDTVQLHSSAYRCPASLPPGPALVVGFGNSGAQIAMELAATRTTWLAGRPRGWLPRRLLGLDVYAWLGRTVLHIRRDSRLGAWLHARTARRGDPLVGIKPRDVEAAGVRRAGRLTGTQRGRPLVEGAGVLDVRAIVWCTGYRPDFSLIDLPVLGDDGYPRHHRGVVDGVPGLYFVGLRFLHRLGSSLLWGVGEDAAYVAAHIAER